MKAASRKRTIRGRLPVTGYATSRTPKPSDGRALRARLKRERIAKAALALAEAIERGEWGPMKTCILCEHFEFSPGDPGYSELTPGYDCSMGCGKGHWSLDVFSDTQTDLRAKMLKAEACTDFCAALAQVQSEAQGVTLSHWIADEGWGVFDEANIEGGPMNKGEVRAFEATGETRRWRNGDLFEDEYETVSRCYTDAGSLAVPRSILRRLTESDLRARYGMTPQERAVIETAERQEHQHGQATPGGTCYCSACESVRTLRESRQPKPRWVAECETTRSWGVRDMGTFRMHDLTEPQARAVAAALNGCEKGATP